MKKYTFKLFDFDVDKLFTPIRNKQNAVVILMQSIKIILRQNHSKQAKAGKIVVVISKMNRIFFFSDKKFYSLSMPFKIEEYNGSLMFSWRNINIDSGMASHIISIFSHNQIDTIDDLYERISEPFSYKENLINNINNPYDTAIIVNKLLMFDEGYIRYDYDELNENGKLHPKFHYDVFYSSSCTFKIGLVQSISEDDLIDLVDIQTECHYISS